MFVSKKACSFVLKFVSKKACNFGLEFVKADTKFVWQNSLRIKNEEDKPEFLLCFELGGFGAHPMSSTCSVILITKSCNNCSSGFASTSLNDVIIAYFQGRCKSKPQQSKSILFKIHSPRKSLLWLRTIFFSSTSLSFSFCFIYLLFEFVGRQC